jgi:CheY-like chemotaxis protein/signal transduction histidine kinase
MSIEPGQGTLLIVDDERGGREALEGLLLNQGYQLEFGASGKEALQKIPQLLPDLVLLDVMMPGMDGFEVCRRLRLDPETAQIPVLLVTALDDRETRLEGISAGADDFISKPYDRAELRLRVKTIMRIGRYRRLLTERARFNSVVEHAADGYLTVRDDGQITYANAAARRFLDLGDDPKMENGGDFFRVARRQYQVKPDQTWKDDELRVPGRHHLLRPETATSGAFWLSVTLLDRPGHDSGERLLRLHDVTQEIDLQRDRHSFHRMVSHKLRTPLNGVVSVLDLLQAELGEGEHAALMSIAVDSARRLHQGVEEILDFASLSSQPHQGEAFPLAELPALLERWKGEMDLRRFTATIDPALFTAKIALSVLQVETIFREILENAVKFHPRKDPTVRVIAQPGPTHNLLLDIHDDGIHLSPHQLAQVWLPYYQGEKHLTGEVAGMGLGLSVVQSTILAKGGTVTLRNNTDSPGIHLHLELPLVSPR